MPLRDILADIGHRPSKGLGQNFLTQPATARRIAACMAPGTATAVEIGPGLGALTAALLEQNIDVFAIEIDARLAAYLKTLFSDAPRFHLIESDALKLDWNSSLDRSATPRMLFGNLPYSTAGRILEKIFQHSRLFTDAILCLQKDVAGRILSAGGRDMGPITLLIHRFCSKREKLFDLAPGSFYPKPDVVSTVFRLVFRPGVEWSDRDRRVPRLLFAHRRKKLSSTVPESALRAAEVALGMPLADKRVDELTIEAAAVLAEKI